MSFESLMVLSLFCLSLILLVVLSFCAFKVCSCYEFCGTCYWIYKSLDFYGYVLRCCGYFCECPEYVNATNLMFQICVTI